MSSTRIHRQRLWSQAPLILVLLLALALRLLLWGRIPRTGLISDEGEYLSAASWLAHGRGFSWYQSYLWTRAPIYPLFVAAHLRLFSDTLTPIYVTQTILSLVNVALVYLLARHFELKIDNEELKKARYFRFPVFNVQCAISTLSALLMACYFPFALYPQVLLSETLYITLLLGGFLALAIWVDQGRRTKDEGAKTSSWIGGNVALGHWSLIAAGGLFGLATLTRSLTLAFVPLAALWVAARGCRELASLAAWWRPTRSSLIDAALFLACAAAVVLPWTIYNSLPRLYGGLVVVDTSGAYNLMLGARTAYDGKREDAPARNFMLALLSDHLDQEARRQLLEAQPASNGRVLDRSCLLARGDPRLLAALERPAAQITQAERQQLMTAEGLCLIGAKPLAFVQKSLSELVDLFQINYTGAERFANGFGVGRLPRWYTLGLFLLDDTIYVLTLPLAVIGWALARNVQTFERLNVQTISLIGLWLLYNIAVAPLLFAINRFRLPLLPFAFIFAAYALAALPRGWRALWSPYGAICATLAAVLALIAATPYAYLEPRPNGEDSRWASYLGPYPSSITATQIAWQSRPGYVIGQQVMRALGSGDAATAGALLERSDVTSGTLQIARPLLAGLQGHAEDGLKLLPPLETILNTGDVEAAVVRGDLLRRLGDWEGARFILTQRFVDDANPVQWAWDWLHPVALLGNHIDLAGNLDLGYIEGCYLGEGDTSIHPAANFRWCTDGARLRFPDAGTGAAQTLALRVDGRAWFDGLRPAPPIHVFVGEQEAGAFTPGPSVAEFSVLLPPTSSGADVVVTLRTDTFIPAADRYLSQQGKPVVGQVQRLGVRLDWAELRDEIEN
ncbi:MAG TPA: hypothetical protein VKE41_14615 [Roseiflexaceae bacterium]|nr:hypothetical protein [Roseiflexaceae bacterium]